MAWKRKPAFKRACPPGILTACQSVIVLCFVLLARFIPAFSQEKEIYRIQRLGGPVIIDGRLDEPAWNEIVPLPMVTHMPVFGTSVEDGTEIRIAYDDDYLYVGGIIYADPEKISAPTYRRNVLTWQVDGLSILIDSFRDNENSLWFCVSPAGARSDAMVSNDGEGESRDIINTFWDAIWEAETEITSFGWTAEMRIPFSSLRYEIKDNMAEMGITVANFSAYNVQMETFPAILPLWGRFSWLKPSQSQPVLFENISRKKPLFVTPYLLGGMDRAASAGQPEGEFLHKTGQSYEAGLDLKMGLTNNTILDLTVNTDFAQVEADDQQINLTRFSLFFPERRQFFLERASIFNFSFGEMDRLFHSRTIGLLEGQPLRILGGSRMISRVGEWDVGLLSMQTATVFEQPSENNSVMRFRRRMFNPQSYAGAMVTSRIDMDGGYNIAYGADGIFKLRGDDFLNFNIAQTIDSKITSPFLSENSLRLRGGLERRKFSGFSFSLNYDYSGIDYSPQMGFQLRQNYMRFGDRISYGWLPGAESPLQHVMFSANSAVFISNLTGEIESSETGPSFEVYWKRGDRAMIEGMMVTENIPDTFSLSANVKIPSGLYNYRSAIITYQTPWGRSMSTGITAFIL